MENLAMHKTITDLSIDTDNGNILLSQLGRGSKPEKTISIQKEHVETVIAWLQQALIDVEGEILVAKNETEFSDQGRAFTW